MPIHHPKPKEAGQEFYDFVEALEEEDKEQFLENLTDDEALEFASSVEQFKMVMGRDPDVMLMPQKLPMKQEDVKDSCTSMEDLQERFDKMKDFFPRSLRDLKKASGVEPGKERPASISIQIMLGEHNGTKEF